MTLVVFDLGETLISYCGIPLNWSEHYLSAIDGFLNKNEIVASPYDLELAASVLEFYNTRINHRLFEVDEGDVTKKIANILGVNYFEFEVSFFAYFQQRVELEPSALETLKELKKQNVFTALLSDVPYGMPRNYLIEDLGILASYIDVIMSSCDVGVRKPHPLGLITLMDQFRMDRNNVYYVGNEEKDINCAKNAKIKSILLQSDKSNSYGQTYSAKTLSDILKYVL